MLPIISRTPVQVEMRNAMQAFLPTDLINLVDGYLTHTDATQALVLGTDGKPLDSELNRTTCDAIQLALTSPDCDRDVIRLIFQHAADHGYNYYLDGVMKELRDQKKAIILDNVDFSGIYLGLLNFEGASLVNVNFAGASLDSVGFIGADLTGVRGLASATGIFRMDHTTVLHNTELAAFAKNLALSSYFKICLIQLPDHPEKCDKIFLSDAYNLLFFSYQALAQQSGAADDTRDSYRIIGPVTDDPTL